MIARTAMSGSADGCTGPNAVTMPAMIALLRN